MFVDLDKAYNKVPREELWHCLRNSGIQEAYEKVVQNMCNGSLTAVRSAVGTIKEISVKIGLH